MKKSNLSVNSKINSNFWAKLKALFALPKWAKIFLGVLSFVAMAGLLGAFALQSWAKDKIQHGEFVLNGVDKSWQERLESGFAYDSRLYFEKADFLLRSKVIAYIDIRDISWVSPIDKNAVSELKSHNRHIKFSTSQNLSEFNGQKLGVVEYKMDFSPLAKTAIKYSFILTICLIGVCVFFNSFKIYPWQNEILPLTKKDYIFLAFAFLLCAGICAFSFWLGFPGYHCCDGAVAYSFPKNGHHPVLYSYILEFLTFAFGRHIYYFFLLNLIPFYLGLFFLITGFYLRSKNLFALMMIFPTFIGNFYFSMFLQIPLYVAVSLYFCLYALLLFLILVPLNANQTQKIIAKILWIFVFILMFVAILWRHNAIFAVFPAFFVLCYVFLKDKNLKSKAFIKRYIVFVFLSAVLCLSVVKGMPKILIQGNEARPAMHTFLHQMAGACVPANDSSCFKEEWYNDGKSFEDVKQIYQENQLHADYMLKVLHDYDMKEWLKAIVKYPSNFLAHELRFFKGLWLSNEHWGQSSKGIQAKIDPDDFRYISDAPSNEHKITFTDKQEKIYTYLFEHKFLLHHAIGVGVGFVLMIVCGVLLCYKKFRNTLLVFSFSASFAGFWMAFFTAAFNPVTQSGYYMSPILPLSLMALFGFVAFVLDYLARKGNFRQNE